MAIHQQAVSAGQWRLRHQVEMACGPATKFSPIEQHLAEWIESGDYVPGATRETVEPYLAGYLAQASAAGKRWGRMAGLAAGGVLGLIVFALVAVIR